MAFFNNYNKSVIATNATILYTSVLGYQTNVFYTTTDGLHLINYLGTDTLIVPYSIAVGGGVSVGTGDITAPAVGEGGGESVKPVSGPAPTAPSTTSLPYIPTSVGLYSATQLAVFGQGLSQFALITLSPSAANSAPTVLVSQLTQTGGSVLGGCYGSCYTVGSTIYVGNENSSSLNLAAITITGSNFSVTDFTTTNNPPSPNSITYDGTYFYTISATNNNIYRISSTGVAVNAGNLTGNNQSGLTIFPSTPGYLYVIDNSTSGVSTTSQYSIDNTIVNTCTLTFIDSRADTCASSTDKIQISSFDAGSGVNPRFYYISTAPSAFNLNKLYLTSGGTFAGGDPHVKPIFGKDYLLENEEKCYKMFDNKCDGDRLIVNAKCWFLPKNIVDEFRGIAKECAIDWLQNYTFIKYISITNKDEQIVIDMDTLETVKYTNDEDVDNYRLIKCDKPDLQTIQIGDITLSNKGLWSIAHGKYIIDGETYDRQINVKNGDCEVRFTFTFSKDTKCDLNTDRNNIALQIKGTRELTPENYTGALIIEDNFAIKSLFYL